MRSFLATLALALLVAAPHASAQTFARRRVDAGEVTGLEMGIEGSLSATPGGRVRWYTTLYEVVRRRDSTGQPRVHDPRHLVVLAGRRAGGGDDRRGRARDD